MEEDALMHNNFDPGGRNQSPENSIAVYQRNFANCLTHGHAVTWFETAELHEHASLVDERQRWMKRFQELGRWGVNVDRTPSADVAVFLDDESYYYESNRNNVDLPLIWRQRVASLNRFGAPHDVYYLEDLLDGNLPPYKLYIFLNAFHLNNQRRAALKQVLRRDGRTALWLYAPGLLNRDTQAGEGDPDYSEQMTDLTGLTFSKPTGAWSPMMHITNFNHPITQGLPQDWFWGAPIRSGRCSIWKTRRRRSWDRWCMSSGATSPALGSEPSTLKTRRRRGAPCTWPRPTSRRQCYAAWPALLAYTCTTRTAMCCMPRRNYSVFTL